MMGTARNWHSAFSVTCLYMAGLRAGQMAAPASPDRGVRRPQSGACQDSSRCAGRALTKPACELLSTAHQLSTRLTAAEPWISPGVMHGEGSHESFRQELKTWSRWGCVPPSRQVTPRCPPWLPKIRGRWASDGLSEGHKRPGIAMQDVVFPARR